jgi:hypothetical protein
MSDLAERRLWDQYMAAYEDMIRNTSTPDAPWYVVPADHKWFTRIVVAAAIVDGLSSLDLAYPDVSAAQREEINKAKQTLDAGDNGKNKKKRRKE